MLKEKQEPGSRDQETGGKKQQYRCLSPIDHSGDHRLYLPGAVITLDHLPPDLIQRLVDGGHVVKVEAEG